MGLSNYPPGVDNGHPHFHDEEIECPRCERRTAVGAECEHCAAPLDDVLADRMREPDEDSYPERER